MRTEPQRGNDTGSSFPSADMKSPPPDTGPPNSQEEKNLETNKLLGTKDPAQSEIEKDSGYSDSSSESLSVTDATPDPPQTACPPIYILQNVVLKQPRILLVLQPPLRHHRKRASPSSHLPLLRSYPRIAPRLAPPSPAPSEDMALTVCTQSPPQLLEVSLRSQALLRRTRETQRSIRELRSHARLYERALQGEEGGWERLRKAMERSGGYRKIPPAIDAERTEEAEEAANTSDASTTTRDDSTASESPTEEEVTSRRKSVTSSEEEPSEEENGGAV
ncbi:uncharacterized protein LOC142709498 [Rhinoderma darwinii]|uniref:uncharacterized protein LOC142709498 n=1 Tax=Rhinoderma darwinii TaxID=43563 RepID=UPI003F66BE98